jgi:prevent-host-death family protein
MQYIEMSDATAPVSDYARDAADEPVVLTKNGKPVAAVISLKGIDRESLSLSQNVKFLSILKRSSARHAAEGGISPDQMRSRLGLKKKS